MERIFLIVILIVTVKASPHIHSRKADDYEAQKHMLRTVGCSSDHESRRSEIIHQANCGKPRDYFNKLKPEAAHLQISPGAVWVKRCQGLCDSDVPSSKCVATSVKTVYIPVRIFNMKTNRETCWEYPVEEHLSCGCCAGSESCPPPRVFDPRKCSCRCPNHHEKIRCRSQRNLIMRWSPSKCSCVERKRMRGT